jgi:hypothetical protein
MPGIGSYPPPPDDDDEDMLAPVKDGNGDQVVWNNNDRVND